MALLQVQALVVSLLAGLIAFVLGLAARVAPVSVSSVASTVSIDVSPLANVDATRGTYFECIMVLCASMLAASLSSAIVGAFMCSLVVLSRRMRINPDNIATPLAASLGDLLSLTLLGLVSSAFLKVMGAYSSYLSFDTGRLSSFAV